MTKNPPRSVATQLIQEALRQTLPKGWYVAAQEPVTLMDSEPEPDVPVIIGGQEMGRVPVRALLL